MIFEVFSKLFSVTFTLAMYRTEATGIPTGYGYVYFINSLTPL